MSISKELAQRLHGVVFDVLGPTTRYVVLARPFEDDLANSIYVSNQQDRKRLADWLRHVADGIERSDAAKTRCEHDTDEDSDCHLCHRTGGCPKKS